MNPIQLIISIILVGFAVSVVTDALPLKPMFKNLIYLVAGIWLVYLIAGWAGVSLPQ